MQNPSDRTGEERVGVVGSLLISDLTSARRSAGCRRLEVEEEGLRAYLLEHRSHRPELSSRPAFGFAPR